MAVLNSDVAADLSSDDEFYDAIDDGQTGLFVSGRIVRIFHDQNYGFVKPDSDQDDASKTGHYFRWAPEHNAMVRGITIGHSVRFSLKPDPTGNKPQILDQLMIFRDADGTFEKLPSVLGRWGPSRSCSTNRELSLTDICASNKGDNAVDNNDSDRKPKPKPKKKIRLTRLSGTVCAVKDENSQKPYGFINPIRRCQLATLLSVT